MNSTAPEGIIALSESRTRSVLLFAASFGLLTGLVEGALQLSLQRLGWLDWSVASVPVQRPILWIAPLFDLVLFLAVALVLVAVARLIPAVPLERAAALVLSFLAFFDWLALSGRIRFSGTLILALGLATVFKRRFHRQPETAMRLARRILPVTAALTLLLFIGIEGGDRWAEHKATAALARMAPGSPSVLILVLDTVRADHLSSYGYGRTTTPGLDRLAQEGVLFENTFAASSWTLPSHVSLLTGRFPHEHGVERGAPYDGRFPMLSGELRNRGYRTGAFSGNLEWFSRTYGFGRGFLHFEDIFESVADRAFRTVYGRKFQRNVMQPMGQEDLPARKHAGEINRSLLRWLEREPERPFFAFVNYFDAHDPYLPPQPYRNRFSRQERPGGILNEFAGRPHPKLSPEQLQGEIDAYDGAIAYLDDEIANLLAELERCGLAQNLLLIVTSDHGEAFGEHGLYLHRNALYRELIRVPLIVRWPGHIPAGARVAEPVSNVALPATVLDLLNGGQQSLFPVPSLAHYWRAEPAQTSGSLPLAELAKMPFKGLEANPSFSGAMKSVITPRWQLITHEKLGDALYDWTRDPSEKDDQAESPEGQRVTAALLRCLRENPSNLQPEKCTVEAPAEGK